MAWRRLSLLAIIFLTGCLSAVKTPHRSLELDLKARDTPPSDSRGAIYLIRPDAYAARASWFAVGVNNKIIGWNANGTFYRLDLPAGKHRLSTFPSSNLRTNAGWATENVDIEVKPGARQYYLHQTGGLGQGLTFNLVSEQVGLEHLASSKLAQYDSREIAVSNMRALFDSNSSSQGSENQSSSRNDGSFVEGLATVLFIGLLVLGAAYAQQPNVAPVPTYAPAISLISELKTTNGQRYRYSDNGDIIGSAGDRWSISGRAITNRNSGTTYEINKNGNTAYGDRGQTYRVDPSKGTLVGADGTACGIASGGVVGCGSQYKYQGKSGTAYQYDLSKPLDQGRYSTDVPAQIRDSINTKPGVNADRDWGQRGGGVQR